MGMYVGIDSKNSKWDHCPKAGSHEFAELMGRIEFDSRPDIPEDLCAFEHGVRPKADQIDLLERLFNTSSIYEMDKYTEMIQVFRDDPGAWFRVSY